MLANPRLVLLDEATSAVDAVAERRLQSALRRLLFGRTSFIVAHNEFGDENYFLTRHLIFLTLGLIAMGFLAGVDYERWRRWAAVVIGFIGVMMALNPTGATFSAASWIAIAGSFSFSLLMICSIASNSPCE